MNRLLATPNLHAPWVLPVTLALLLSGCGFQLRGEGTSTLSPELKTLRVQVQGGLSANDPLQRVMEDTLRIQAGVVIAPLADVPTLVLSAENSDTQVLSIGSSGKANEYLLRYFLTFSVLDAKGEVWAPPQTLRLQKDYSFNPANLLAKEQEEQNLRRELQRDALSQIVRRLSRLKPVKQDAAQP